MANLIIDKTRIPLLLDYDFEFALADENRVGKIGQRDGVVSHIYPVNHDYYSLKFLNSTGAVIDGSAK